MEGRLGIKAVGSKRAEVKLVKGEMEVLKVLAASPGAWGDSLRVTIEDRPDNTFNVKVGEKVADQVVNLQTLLNHHCPYHA